jgi:hypothetical protein
MSKKIKVENPMECPFNSECQCKLYGMFEGDQAQECPLGSYGDYKFPHLCPLLNNNYIVSKATGE